MITPILRKIITVQPLGTPQPPNPATTPHIIRDTHPRKVTRHPEIVRHPRIVLAGRALAAFLGSLAVAAAGRVRVAELACALAAVQVGAGCRGWSADLVGGAGDGFDAAGAVGGDLGGGCEAEEGRGDEDGEMHVGVGVVVF